MRDTNDGSQLFPAQETRIIGLRRILTIRPISMILQISVMFFFTMNASNLQLQTPFGAFLLYLKQ